MNKFNSKKGFSLVESLIYVSAFALISITLVQVIISINKAYVSIKATQALEMSASDSFNRMSRDIRNAKSIILGTTSIFKSSPGKLALSSKDGSGNIHTVEYYVDADKMLQVKVDGVSAGKLTSSSTPVSGLIFSQVVTGNSSAIKIDLSLQTLKDKVTITESFHSTYVLRGSY